MLKREQRALVDYYIECLVLYNGTKHEGMIQIYGARMVALVEVSKRLNVPARMFEEARRAVTPPPLIEKR